MGLGDILGGLAHSAVRSIPGVGPALDDGLGQLTGGLQGVSDFMGDGSHALIAAQLANAAYNQKKQGDYAGQALDTVKGQWDGQAPLRQAGQAGMLNPGQGIAARIAAIPQGSNPFAAKPQVGPAQAPGLAPAMAGPQGPAPFVSSRSAPTRASTLMGKNQPEMDPAIREPRLMGAQ